jgi:hypothetical protein
MDLTNAPQLSELREDQGHCRANPLIWILIDPIMSYLNVTYRHCQKQLTTSCLLLQCFH